MAEIKNNRKYKRAGGIVIGLAIAGISAYYFSNKKQSKKKNGKSKNTEKK